MSAIANHPEQAYLDLLREILEQGVENHDRGTGAITNSVFGRQIRFNLSEGFPLLTTKRVYWKGVLHELYWFLSGQSNIKYLVDQNVHIWDDYPYKIYNEKVKAGLVPEISKEAFISQIAMDNSFAESHGNLPNIYGELWRRWPTRDGRTVDQVAFVLDELRNDPDARNCIVNSWNPEYLYSMALPEEACRFPLCHNMYQVSIKNNKLSLHLYQRSADMFLGVPFNIGSYALLAHIFAHFLGVEVGDFIHTFGDAHIYSNHFDQVREQLTRDLRLFPTVRIDPLANTLESFRPEHVMLEGYDPHPTLKGELTVAGGYRAEDHRKKTDS